MIKVVSFKTSLCFLIFSSLVCFLSLGGCAKYSEEVQENLTKLKTTKSCSGCDLTGIELVAFDL